MFKITDGKGFHIQFSNGYVVSVQFGGGNYCDNRLYGTPPGGLRDAGTCANAEVAVFLHDPDRGWYRPTCLNRGDDVAGYVTPDQLAQVIAEVQALPSADDVMTLSAAAILPTIKFRRRDRDPYRRRPQ